MTVQGSYNSYILLKSGTSVMSTRYMTAKFFTCWSSKIDLLLQETNDAFAYNSQVSLQINDTLYIFLP